MKILSSLSSEPTRAAFTTADIAVQNPLAHAALCLDGQWNTIIDPYENGFYSYRYEESLNGYFKYSRTHDRSDLDEYDFERSAKLQVPGDWNSQEEKLFLYEGTMWYHKAFSIKKHTGLRYILHFSAVNYKAIVYLNGQKIGAHEGGFTSFQVDASAIIQSGENNLVLKVDNSRALDFIPTLNTDWWNYGGITRSVHLLSLDKVYLKDYGMEYCETKKGKGKSKIRGWAQLGGEYGSKESVRVIIEELGINRTIPVDENGCVAFDFNAKPVLWSPDAPKLYDIKIKTAGQTIVDKIGFRLIKVQGSDICLNNKPIFLCGISIHEEAPGRAGRAWSEDDARTLLRWAKELGCNFVRLAHYPHNEHMLRIADEMGLLVWAEIPVYWTIQFSKKSVLAKAKQQLEEMIARDKNRASIILWSIANETPNTKARLKFLRRLIKHVKALDSSRLVTAAIDTQQHMHLRKKLEDPLAEHLDVIGINSYCGWYGDTPEMCAETRWESPYTKPVIISEMGAGALQGYHSDSTDRWSEEYQAEVYINNLIMIDNMAFVRGLTPWILKDFRSPRRPLPGIQDFWNRKGLLSEKGIRKKAWYVLRDYYEKKQDKEK